MSAHVAPVRTLFTVFVVVVVLTVITAAVASSTSDFLNTPIALGIAVFKASLVVWFFMGVRWNTPLTKVVVVAGLLLAAHHVRADDERLPDSPMAGRAGTVASRPAARAQGLSRSTDPTEKYEIR